MGIHQSHTNNKPSEIEETISWFVSANSFFLLLFDSIKSVYFHDFYLVQMDKMQSTKIIYLKGAKLLDSNENIKPVQIEIDLNRRKITFSFTEKYAIFFTTKEKLIGKWSVCVPIDNLFVTLENFSSPFGASERNCQRNGNKQFSEYEKWVSAGNATRALFVNYFEKGYWHYWSDCAHRDDKRQMVQNIHPYFRIGFISSNQIRLQPVSILFTF